METSVTNMPKANKIKICIIIGILATIIFVSVFVWKRYQAKNKIEVKSDTKIITPESSSNTPT